VTAEVNVFRIFCCFCGLILSLFLLPLVSSVFAGVQVFYAIIVKNVHSVKVSFWRYILPADLWIATDQYVNWISWIAGRWLLTIIRHVAEMFAHSGDVLSQRSINSSRCCGTSVLLCRNSNISSMLLWYLQPQTLYGIWNTTTRLLSEKQRLTFQSWRADSRSMLVFVCHSYS